MALIEKCDECGWEPPAHSASCSHVAHIMKGGMASAFEQVDRDAAERRERSRAARIAANRGPYFPGALDVIVQVVESGTVIDHPRGGEALTVHENTAVKRDNHIFVTQSTWDALLRHTNVRRIG